LRMDAPFRAPWEQLLRCKSPLVTNTETNLTTVGDVEYWVVRDSQRISLLCSNKQASGGRWQRKSSEQQSTDAPAALLLSSLFNDKQLVCLIVRMMYGGTPSIHARLYQPMSADYDRIRKGNNVSSIRLEQPPVDRAFLGYVTSGELGYRIAKGHAIAFCSATALLKLSSDAKQNGFSEDIILLRNTTSLYFHYARISIR